MCALDCVTRGSFFVTKYENEALSIYTDPRARPIQIPFYSRLLTETNHLHTEDNSHRAELFNLIKFNQTLDNDKNFTQKLKNVELLKSVNCISLAKLTLFCEISTLHVTVPKFKTVTQYTYSTSHEHTWAERDFNIICVLRTSRTNEQLVRNQA